MNPSKQLYFIALLPPDQLTKKIHSIKEEIASKFHSRYSLKIPEHVTLIPPFHCSDELLEVLITRLKSCCQTVKPFEVLLKDFGHFNKSVLFIQASSQPKEALDEVQSAFKKLFSEEFSSVKLPHNGEKFTPHVTVANKDLTKGKFKEAWLELKEREFEEKFTVKSIFLLKHVEGIWHAEIQIPFENL
jgi:2'-5' RNA ligase